MSTELWLNIRLKDNFTPDHNIFMERLNKSRRPIDTLGSDVIKFEEFLENIHKDLGLKFSVKIDLEHNSINITEDGWVEPTPIADNL
ncbi:MAG: hypothetical protein ACRCX2_03005 [Paraclostridium sp.]